MCSFYGLEILSLSLVCRKKITTKYIQHVAGARESPEHVVEAHTARVQDLSEAEWS